MNRRALLRTLGAGVIGVGISGCAGRLGFGSSPGAAQALRVSWGRVIGSVVGLRPFRPSGFRLEAERLGNKTVIHNYGHGGGGVSLSWGTGQLAAEEASLTGQTRAAVIGAGIVGMTTARKLQSRGFDVTIYSEAAWPDPSVLSGHAPARFTPSASIVDPEYRTSAFDALYENVAALSYREWHGMVGQGYGVSWRDSYRLSDVAPVADSERGPSSTGVGQAELLGPRDHPFSTTYALRQATMMMDMPIVLNALFRDFRIWGGELVVRRFTGLDTLLTLEEPVIVNCSGLGARTVCGDSEVIPLRGQLTHVLPQENVDFIVTAGGFSLVPRSDGLILGGAPNRRNDWSMDPDVNDESATVERAIEVLGGMNSLPQPEGGRRMAGGGTPEDAHFPASQLFVEATS